MDGEKFYVMSDEMDTHVGIVRHNLMAMLTGDVKQVEELLGLYGNNPIPIATINWEGVETQVNSYLFSYVLYDAFRYEEQFDLFGTRHVQELLDLQVKCKFYAKTNFICEVMVKPRGKIQKFE